jgi:hypothetical protein
VTKTGTFGVSASAAGGAVGVTTRNGAVTVHVISSRGTLADAAPDVGAGVVVVWLAPIAAAATNGAAGKARAAARAKPLRRFGECSLLLRRSVTSGV